MEVVQALSFSFISDVTPPTVTNCPVSFSKKTNNAWETVTWVEPQFHDNVGVTVVSNKKPGQKVERWTSVNVQYIGMDGAGNKAVCEFSITVSGEPFHFPVSLSKLNMKIAKT